MAPESDSNERIQAGKTILRDAISASPAWMAWVCAATPEEAARSVHVSDRVDTDGRVGDPKPPGPQPCCLIERSIRDDGTMTGEAMKFLLSFFDTMSPEDMEHPVDSDMRFKNHLGQLLDDLAGMKVFVSAHMIVTFRSHAYMRPGGRDQDFRFCRILFRLPVQPCIDEVAP